MKSLIIPIIIILVLIAGASILVIWSKQKPVEKAEQGLISEIEKEQIEAWIIENDLNQYGDPKDTVYTGGTPLFDEKTGERIDKYEYILRRHPNRPWLLK